MFLKFQIQVIWHFEMPVGNPSDFFRKSTGEYHNASVGLLSDYIN